MKEYFYCALLTAIACAVVGAAPLFRPRGPFLIKIFFLFSYSISIWSLGLSFHAIASTQQTSTVVAMIMHYGVAWIPVFYFHFIIEFLEIKRPILLRLAYITAIGLTIANSFRLLIAPSVPKLGFQYFMEPGPLYPVLMIFFAATVIYTLRLLLKYYSVNFGVKQNQIKYVFVSTLIGYAGGSTNFFPVYNLWIYPLNPYGTLCIVLYLMALVYAILALRLFDFNLIARWGIAYALLLLISVLGFMGTFLILTSLHIPKLLTILGLPCLMVFIYEPLKAKTTKFVDHFIFRSPDFQTVLAGINNTLNGSHTIQSLTENLSIELNKILNTTHSGLVIWDQESSSYLPFPIETFSSQVISRIGATIDQRDFLVRTLESERRIFKYGIVTEDELTSFGLRAFPGERITFWKMRRTMRWLGAAICIPLMANTQLSGFIVLGYKKNHSIYNQEDKKFLSHVATLISDSIKEFLSTDLKSQLAPNKSFI